MCITKELIYQRSQCSLELLICSKDTFSHLISITFSWNFSRVAAVVLIFHASFFLSRAYLFNLTLCCIRLKIISMQSEGENETHEVDVETTAHYR